MLAKGRRYAIVGIFIFAAVVTPPDVISQVGLAIPMIALYEISIIAAKLAERARRKREEEDEADAEAEAAADTAAEQAAADVAAQSTVPGGRS